MDNAGYSGDTAPPPASSSPKQNGTSGPSRAASYTKRKISSDYNANEFAHVNQNGAAGETRDTGSATSAGRRRSNGATRERNVSVLPDLAPADPNAKSWAQQTGAEKTKTVIIGILKFVGFLACLYFFICSLDLLGSGFNLLGGKAVGEIFQVRKRGKGLFFDHGSSCFPIKVLLSLVKIKKVI